MTKLVSRRRVLAGAAGLAAAATLPRTARAQWRPTEAIKIIIPAAPGGTTDLMGRMLGQHVAALIGLGEAAAEQQAKRQRSRDRERTSLSSGHGCTRAPLRHPGG